MPSIRRKREDTNATRDRIRNMIRGGGNILLDRMTADELSVAQELIFNGEAEIVSAACKPFLVAKLDRTIIS